ncbi:MAG TPA: HupE/UreJ family protein [Polyangia bacterium]
MKRWAPRGLVSLVALVVWLGTFGAAFAHEFKPGLLALVETADGNYEVTWRLPIEDAGYPLRPVFPPGTSRLPGGSRAREGDAIVERFSVQRAGGLGGQTLRLGGTAPGITEILVRIEARGGQLATGHLSTRTPAFEVPAVPTRAGITWLYLRLGVEHILSGVDHLAFVLLLVLLAPAVGAVVRAVTAFTVAHSLTLALAALGVVHVPQAPVEATIALSILLLARQLAVRDRGTADPRVAPWLSAFGFGLLHGLGFAGALSSVGLPAKDIPLALFSFNLGVEAGQLGFVAVVLGIRRAFAPFLTSAAFRQTSTSTSTSARARVLRGRARAPVWGLGAVAAFWLIERVVAFF